MRATHEDALVCDFAQYYHIYDLDALPVGMMATLACGLPKDSRTFREIRNEKLDRETILMASILDTVRSIEYAFFQTHTKKKLKRPKSVLQKLMGLDPDSKEEVKGFASGSEFDAARQRLVEET